MGKKYEKILIAKKSEDNKCYAENGEWLIIADPSGKKVKGLPKDYHYFIGINSHKSSMYGWVKKTHVPITVKEFAEKIEENYTEEILNRCKQLLDSIENEKEDTPIAVTYSTVGIIEKKRILRVHRVFFYNV